MKKEIIYNINDEQQLDNIFYTIRNSSQKEIKNIFSISIIITIIFCGIIAGILIYFNNHSTPNVQADDSGNGFLLLIFVSIIIAIFFYFYRKSKYNNVNGRTTILVPIDNNVSNEIIDKILNDLYYEKVGQDIYYAYKTKSSFINASSVKRYLSYKINDNKLIIQVWKKYGNEEKPLNYGQIDRFVNMASLYDLKVIISNLPKINNNLNY